MQQLTTSPRTVQSTPRVPSELKVALLKRLADGRVQALSSDGHTIYTVNLDKLTCSCPAGQNGRRCYHLRCALERYENIALPVCVLVSGHGYVEPKREPRPANVIDFRPRAQQPEPEPPPPAASARFSRPALSRSTNGFYWWSCSHCGAEGRDTPSRARAIVATHIERCASIETPPPPPPAASGRTLVCYHCETTVDVREYVNTWDNDAPISLCPVCFDSPIPLPGHGQPATGSMHEEHAPYAPAQPHPRRCVDCGNAGPAAYPSPQHGVMLCPRCFHVRDALTQLHAAASYAEYLELEGDVENAREAQHVHHIGEQPARYGVMEDGAAYDDRGQLVTILPRKRVTCVACSRGVMVAAYSGSYPKTVRCVECRRARVADARSSYDPRPDGWTVVRLPDAIAEGAQFETPRLNPLSHWNVSAQLVWSASGYQRRRK